MKSRTNTQKSMIEITLNNDVKYKELEFVQINSVKESIQDLAESIREQNARARSLSRLHDRLMHL